MSTTIINLITDTTFASDMIVKYCRWIKKPAPFNTYAGNKMFARTKDVKLLIEKSTVFINLRSQNIRLYQDLGAMRLVDTSERSLYVNDPRLLVTWLHNPESVALALLSNQRSFNAFVNSQVRTDEQLESRYSMGYLSNVYYQYLDLMMVNDFRFATVSEKYEDDVLEDLFK